MLLLYVIGGLVFVGVAIPIVGMYLESRAVRARDRIRHIQAPTHFVGGAALERELQKSFFERAVRPVVKRLGAAVLRMTPAGAVESARKKLDMAGSPAYLDAATLMVLRAISLSVGIMAAVAIVALWREGLFIHKYPVALFVVFAGYLMPDYMLDSKIRSRQFQITKSMPDIIDLLVVSAEAGTGLDGALAEVVRRKKGPLPDEFDRVLTEIRLGKRRREAWQDLADRCGVDDLRTLVAALHQAEELGVSISNTLRAQSDSLRTRRSLRIRAAAATLSTKLLFPLIFCIFPSLFVVVLGPGLMSIDNAMKGIGW